MGFSLTQLFTKFESGGNYNIGTGGANLSNAPLGEHGFPLWSGYGNSHAAGFFMFEPGTWNPVATNLGITDFSPQSQNAVFQQVYSQQGLNPWTCPGCNPGLTNFVNTHGGPGAAINDIGQGGNTGYPNASFSPNDVASFTPDQSSQVSDFGQAFNGNTNYGDASNQVPIVDNGGGQFGPAGVSSDAQSSGFGFGQFGTNSGQNAGNFANQPLSFGANPTAADTQSGGQILTDGSGNTFIKTAPQQPATDVSPDQIQWSDPGSSSVNAPIDTSGGSSGGAGGVGSQIMSGPGMPVSDQGLAKGVNQAGQTIAQAISNPLSGAVKQEGQDVTQAGQTVSTGVNTAANTVSKTASGILSGAESYVGTFFTYAAVLVIGIVAITVGLSKFGGPTVKTVNAR